MRYIILNEYISDFQHSITRLGIFKHDAFVQEINYWKRDKRFTQDTFPLGLEALQILKNNI